MADHTKIEWTDSTWNALRGCSKVSAGCCNCYACGMAARFSKPGQWGHGLAEPTYGGPRWTGTVVLDEKALLKPLRWKKPRRVFVTSIGDPFHPSVTDEMLDRLFAVMVLCPRHTFQLLTKRPERMRKYLGTPALYDRVHALLFSETGILPLKANIPNCDVDTIIALMDVFAFEGRLPNLLLGVSVEDQASADRRIPHLLETPATVRFLSCEPLLGPVNLTRVGYSEDPFDDCGGHPEGDDGVVATGMWWDATAGLFWSDNRHSDGTRSGLELSARGPKLDWVIVGGESGPKARPMHPDWARSLRYQCAAAHIPFNFKQWGTWGPFTPEALYGRCWASVNGKPMRQYDYHTFGRDAEWCRGELAMLRIGKAAAGRHLDGQIHDAYPTAS